MNILAFFTSGAAAALWAPVRYFMPSVRLMVAGNVITAALLAIHYAAFGAYVGLVVAVVTGFCSGAQAALNRKISVLLRVALLAVALVFLHAVYDFNGWVDALPAAAFLLGRYGEMVYSPVSSRLFYLAASVNWFAYCLFYQAWGGAAAEATTMVAVLASVFLLVRKRGSKSGAGDLHLSVQKQIVSDR